MGARGCEAYLFAVLSPAQQKRRADTGQLLIAALAC